MSGAEARPSVLISQLLTARILLIVGKGGVGRTSVAAAVARAAAQRGERVLLAEVGDPQGAVSPLAGIFGRTSLPTSPAWLDAHLDGVQLWAAEGHAGFLRDTLPGGAMLSAALRSRALQRFLESVPAFAEMGLLYHALTLAQQRGRDGELRYQRLVLDMPATGHALALTALPDILDRLLRGGPVQEALRRGRDLLTDGQQTAAWVVTLPERLPVSEALELVEGLRDSHVPTAGLLLNRLPTLPFDESLLPRLGALFTAHPFAGAVPLRAMIAARSAVTTLDQRSSLPVVSLPEMESSADSSNREPEVVGHLTTHLLGGEP